MLSYLIASFLIVPSQGGASPAQQAPVKGQQQIAGGTGVFGTTYSLKNGFNFAILGGRYTLDPYDGYESITPQTDQKLLVLDVAIKNANPGDNFFNIDSMFTLVDDKGELYTGGELMLESKPKEPSFTLRPGQGFGQPALKDPLHVGFAIPATARIAKIMLNIGRRDTNEEAIRYLLVAPPKDPKTATNKNWLTPLPDTVRDATDAFGAIAIDEGKASLKSPVVSGPFRLSVESIDAPGDAVFGGNPGFVAVPHPG